MLQIKIIEQEIFLLSKIIKPKMVEIKLIDVDFYF